LFATLSLSSTLARAADVPIGADAKAHFEAGVNLLQDPDGARHEEAYREFKAAYAASPSWKILGNLGITAMKLERDGEAILAFEKYLAEGGASIDPEERAQVERDLSTLKAGVVTLTLNPAGDSVLDERFTASGGVVQNTYSAAELQQPLGVRAGRHRLTARAAGKAPAVWEVELSPKQQQSHAFTWGSEQSAVAGDPRSSGGMSSLRIGSYVALGVGIVGVGVGTIFALKSKSEYDAGNEACPDFPCRLTSAQQAERVQHGEDGDSAKTLGIVGFAVGGVGLATGLTLFLLSGKSRSPETARVLPYVGLGNVGVQGAF
jgi:hypothetical protein